MEKERDDLKQKLAECELECERLRKELNECKITIKKYEEDLKSCHQELTTALEEIRKLNEIIIIIKAEKEKCEHNLDDLRCETSKFSKKVGNTANILYQLLQSGADMSASVEKDVKSFVDTYDIHCKEGQC